jgi:glycosyltransferase involved in cell wall biosynthesis
MKLSICIPTFNRRDKLPNCLNSIYIASKKTNIDFEVCISDNGSDYNVDDIVNKFNDKFKIKVNKNKSNIGYMSNLIKVISLSESEFVWAIGDDDLLMPHSLVRLEELFSKNTDVDFFFINSFHLDYKHVDSFDSPFDTKNLPKNMEVTLGKNKISQKLNFWDLIDHNIDFGFLVGNFLDVFKRKMWEDNLDCLDKDLVSDTKQWSNFDNTCGHTKVYANAFKNSKAYFCAEGLTVNGHGVREWNKLYPFIEIIRFPEILDYYRQKGLSLKSYLLNKNFALRNFTNYFFKILIHGKSGGLHYINFYRHIFLNLLYPNVYLSFIYSIIRKIKELLKRKT